MLVGEHANVFDQFPAKLHRALVRRGTFCQGLAWYRPTDSVVLEVIALLPDAPVHPTIPVNDLERSKRFYRDTLSLKVAMEMPEGVLFDCGGGTQLYLYPTPSAGQAAHTLASWVVTDLDAETRELRTRGVTFEEYHLPGLKTVEGVAEWGRLRGCWFRDSEGNILGVTEMREH